MAEDMEKELAAVLDIRRIRLQRAEAAVAKARQGERRAHAEVESRQVRAEEVAEQNREQEAALALDLFNRETSLSHITSFRTQVSTLRKGVVKAREDVEAARADVAAARVATREALDVQREAYRKVEKLQFSLTELKSLADEGRYPDDDRV